MPRSQVYRAEITDLLHDQQDNQQVIAELLIPETVGNFTVREIGIFDEQNKLVAVANCPENYKPVLEQGSGKVQYYRIILRVSNNDAVTLSINNNIVYSDFNRQLILKVAGIAGEPRDLAAYSNGEKRQIAQAVRDMLAFADEDRALNGKERRLWRELNREFMK